MANARSAVSSLSNPALRLGGPSGLSRIVQVASVLLALGSAAQAQEIAWDGNGTGNNWTTDDNWRGNNEPGTNNTATFAFASGGTNDIDSVLTANRTVGGFATDNDDSDYPGTVTINDNITLTLDDSGTQGGHFRWDDGASANGSVDLAGANSQMLIDGDAIFTNGGATATFTNAGTVTFTNSGDAGNDNVDWNAKAGINWGNVVVNKGGTQIVTLQSDITCTNLTITSGTVNLNGFTLTVTGALVLNGGDLTDSGTGTLSVGTTTTVSDAASSLTANNQSYTGDVSVSAGSLTLGAGTSDFNGNLTVGATFDMASNPATLANGFDISAGTFSNPGQITFDGANTPAAVVINDAASTTFGAIVINKDNASDIVRVTAGGTGSDNLISPQVTVTQGVLDLQVASTFGDATNGTTVSANGTLQNTTTVETHIFNGPNAGNSLTVDGTATFTAGATATLQFAENTTAQINAGGRLEVDNASLQDTTDQDPPGAGQTWTLNVPSSATLLASNVTLVDAVGAGATPLIILPDSDVSDDGNANLLVAKRWTGALNDDWTDPGNWFGGVPGPTDAAVFDGTSNGGSGAATNSPATLRAVIVLSTYSGTAQLDAALALSELNVSGINGGSFNLGGQTVTFSGSLAEIGQSALAGTGTFAFNASATASISTSTVIGPSLQVTNSSTLTLTDNGPQTGAIQIDAGSTLNATAVPMNVDGTLTVNGDYQQRTTGTDDTLLSGNLVVGPAATFTHGGGELRFDAGTPTWDGGDVNVGAVQTDVGVTLTTNNARCATLNITAGTFSLSNLQLTLVGDDTNQPLTATGTFDGSTGTLVVLAQITGATTVTLPGGSIYNNLTLTPSAAETYAFAAAATLTGTLVINDVDASLVPTTGNGIVALAVNLSAGAIDLNANAGTISTRDYTQSGGTLDTDDGSTSVTITNPSTGGSVNINGGVINANNAGTGFDFQFANTNNTALTSSLNLGRTSFSGGVTTCTGTVSVDLASITGGTVDLTGTNGALSVEDLTMTLGNITTRAGGGVTFTNNAGGASAVAISGGTITGNAADPAFDFVFSNTAGATLESSVSLDRVSVTAGAASLSNAASCGVLSVTGGSLSANTSTLSFASASVSAGTLNGGASGTLSCSGTLAVTGTGALNVNGGVVSTQALTMDNGSITTSDTTNSITLDGGAASTLTISGGTLNRSATGTNFDFRFNNTAGATVTTNQSLGRTTYTGGVTQLSGSVTTFNAVIAAGTLDLNTSGGLLTTGTLSMGSGALVTRNNATPSVTLNDGAGTGAALALTGGNVTSNAAAGNFDFDLTDTDGVTIQGDPATGTFGRVRVSAGCSVTQQASDVTMVELEVTGAGALFTGSANTLTVSGVVDIRTGGAITGAGGSLAFSGATNVTNGVLTLGSGDLDQGGLLTLGGSGTIDMASNDATLGSSFSHDSGGTLSNQGTFTFDSAVAGSITISDSGNTAINTIVINKDNNADVVTLSDGSTSGTLLCTSLTVTRGLFDLQTNTTLGSGAAGTSVAANGTIRNQFATGKLHVFNGPAAGNSLSVAGTLTVTAAATHTLQFAEDTTLAITGTATVSLSGATLQDTTDQDPPTATQDWNFNLGASATFTGTNLTVIDSVGAGATPIVTSGASSNVTDNGTVNWVRGTRWLSTAASTNWGDGANWSGGVPSATQAAVFDSGSNGAPNYPTSLGGGTPVSDINGLVITSAFANAVAIDGALTISGDVSFNNGGGGSFAIGANTVTFSGSSISLTGAFGGGDAAAVLDITTTTTLTFAASATLDAQLTCSANTVTLAGAGPADIDDISITGGTLDANANSVQVDSQGVFSLTAGTYSQRNTGSNDTLVAGNVTATGGTFTSNGGQLVMDTGAAQLNANLNIGSLAASADVTVVTNDPTVTLLSVTAGTFSLGTTSRTLTLAGDGTSNTPLSVAGTFTGGTNGTLLVTAQGAGNVSLPSVTYFNLTLDPAAAETYVPAAGVMVSGALAINNGTLSCGANTITAAGITIGDGTGAGGSAVLNAGTGGATTSAGLSVNATDGDYDPGTSGLLTFSGAGNWQGPAAENYGAVTITSNGVAPQNAINTAALTLTGASLVLGAGNTLTASGVISGTGTLNASGAVNVNAGGGLTVTNYTAGAGTLTFTGVGDWTGTGPYGIVNVNPGAGNSVTLTGSVQTSALSIEDGTLACGGNTVTAAGVTVGDGTGAAGSAVLNAGTGGVTTSAGLSVNATDGDYNPGASGTLTFSGAGNWAGPAAENYGAVVVTAASVAPQNALNVSTLTITGVTLALGAGNHLVASGLISGTGTLNATGAVNVTTAGGLTVSYTAGTGTLTFDGAGTWSGAGNFGIVSVEAAVSAGSALTTGALTITGGNSLTLGAGNDLIAAGISGGGAIDASGAVNVTTSAGLTASYTAGTGTLTFSGTGGWSGGGNFGAVVVNPGAGNSVTLGGDVACGTLSIEAGTLTCGANTVTAAGITVGDGGGAAGSAVLNAGTGGATTSAGLSVNGTDGDYDPGTSGTLTFSGAGNWAGPVAENYGAVVITSAGVAPQNALNVSTLTITGVSFALGAGNNLVASGLISGTGTLNATGAVNVNAGGGLTVSNYTAGSGTLTFDGAGNWSGTGPFGAVVVTSAGVVPQSTLSVGTLTITGVSLALGAGNDLSASGLISGTGTLDATGAVNVDAGAGLTVTNYTAGSGTLTFSGAGNWSGAGPFGAVVVTSAGVAPQNTLSLTTLTVTGVSFALGAGNHLTASGLISGTGTLNASGAVNVSAGGGLTVTNYTAGAGTLTFAGAGTWSGTGPYGVVDVAAGAVVALSGDKTTSGLTMTSGTLTIGANTLGCTTLALDGGTLNVNNASSIVNASGAVSSMAGSAVTMSNGQLNLSNTAVSVAAATFTGTGGTTTLSGGAGTSLTTGANTTFFNLTVAAGTSVTQGGAALDVDGALSCGGALTVGAGTAAVAGSVSITATTGSLAATAVDLNVTGGLTVNGTLTMTAGRTVTVGGNLDGTAGTLTVAGGSLQVAGNCDLSGLTTVTWGAGSLTMNSAAGAQLLTAHSSNFNDVVINNTAPDTVTLAAGAGITTIAGALTITNGTFLLARSLTVNGAVLINGTLSCTVGSLTHTFGGGVTVTGAGSTFSLVIAAATGDLDVVFSEGTTVTVAGTGTFTTTGFNGANRVILRDDDVIDSGDGIAGADITQQWSFAAALGATVSVNTVTLQDSDATASAASPVANGSVDKSLNENWTFPGVTTVWQGPGNDWSVDGNWSQRSPLAGDTVEFGENAVDCTINTAPTGLLGFNMNANNYTGTVTFNNGLSINGPVSLRSTVNLNGQTLTVLGTNTFTLTTNNSGTLNTGAGTLNVVGGASTISGDINVDANGTCTLGGSAEIDGTITINGAAAAVTVTGDVANTSNGTITDGANSGSLTLGGATIDASNLDLTVDGSTINFNGGAAQAITLAGGDSFGALTVGANGLTLSGADLDINGTAALNGDLNTGGQDVVIDGQTTVGAGATLQIVTGGTVTLTGGLTGTGNLTQAAGTLAIPATPLDLSTLNQFNCTGGTQQLSGAGVQAVTLGGSVDFNDLEIANGASFSGAALDVAGNLTNTLGATVLPNNAANDVAGNLVLGGGSINTTAGLSVGGAATIDGTLTHGAGTLSITGNLSSTGGGAINASSNVSLGGGTLTLDGNLAYNQTAGTLLLNGGSAQQLNVSGGGDNFVSVTVDNTGGATLPGDGITLSGTLTVNDPLTLSNTSATSVAGLVMNTGATGDVFSNNGQNLTVTGGGTVTLTEGIFTVTGGTVVLGTGAFTANANSEVNHTGGRIQAAATTMDLSNMAMWSSSGGATTILEFVGGGGAQSLSVSPNVTLATFTITNANPVQLAAGDLSITNNFDLRTTFTTNANSVTVGGNLFDGGGTSSLVATGAPLISITGNFNVDSFTAGTLLRFTGTGTWANAGGSNFGAVEVQNNTRTLSGAIQATSLTVNNGGTVDVNGNALDVNGALTVGSGTAGTLDNGIATLSSLTVAGNLLMDTNSVLTNGDRITLDLDAGGAQTYTTNDLRFLGVRVGNNGASNVTVNGLLNVGTQGLYVEAGTLNVSDATANAVNVQGDVNLTSTFILPSTATFSCAASGTKLFYPGSAARVFNVAITSGTVQLLGTTLQIGSDAANRNNLSVSSGATLDVDADLTIWGTSLIQGTLDLQQSGITIRFGDGQTHTWDDNCTVTIGSNQTIFFLSTSTGVQWNLSISATGTTIDLDSGQVPNPGPQGVRVQDSNATGSPLAPVTNGTGVNFGNNLNWNDLADVQSTWTGASNTDWSNAGNWTPIAPVAGSIVVFDNSSDGNNAPALNSPSFSLTELRIESNYSLGTVTISQALTLTGNLTIDAGQFVTNSQDLSVGGTASGSGTLTGTGSANITVAGITVTNFTAGTLLTFSGTGSWTDNGAATNYGAVVVDGGGTTTTLGGTVQANSIQVNNGATLDLNANTLDINGDVTLGSTGDGVLSGATNSLLQVSGNFAVQNSSTIASVITSSFDGVTQNFTPRTGVTNGHIQVQGTSTVTLLAALDVESVDVNGTLTAGANDITAAGTVDLTGGNFTHSGTLTLDGGGSRSLFLNAQPLNDLATADATTVVQVEDALTVGGTTTLGADSTLRIKPGASATFTGSVTVNGTLDMDATTTFNAALTVENGGTFSATSNQAFTISFDEVSATTLNTGATFNVDPVAGTFVDLRSTVLGNQWDFVRNGGVTVTASRVRVQDSNLQTNGITATNGSVDLGNNSVLWMGLAAPDLTWLGGTDTDWNNDANWSDTGVLPVPGSIVTFTGTPTFMPALNTPASLRQIVMDGTGVFNPAAALTLTQDLSLSDGLSLSENSDADAAINCGGFVLTANGAATTIGIPINNGTLRFAEGGTTNLTLTGDEVFGAALEVGNGGSNTTLNFVANNNDLTCASIAVDTGSTLDVDGVTGVVVDSNAAVTLNGTGQALLGSNTLQVAGNVTVTGTLTFAAGGFLIFDGAANQTLSLPGTATLQSVTVNKANTLTVQDGNFNLGQNFLQSAGNTTLATSITSGAISGTLTANAGTLTIGDNVQLSVTGTWTTTAATVVPGTGTARVDFNGAGQTLNYGANTAFWILRTSNGNLTLNGANTLAIGDALEVNAGTLEAAANGLDVGGDLTFVGGATLDLGTNDAPLNVAGSVVNFTNGNLTNPGTASVTLDGAAAQALTAAAETITRLVIGGTSVTTLQDALTCTAVTINNGARLNLAGALTTVTCANAGTLDIDAQTLTITGGTTAQPLSGAGTLLDTTGTGLVDYATSGAAVGFVYTLGNFNYSSVRVNQADRVFRNVNALTLSNDLTVAAGNYNAEANLTISDQTSVAAGLTLTVTTTLQTASLTGAGTVDTAENSATIVLTGGGTPFTITNVNGLRGGTLGTVQYSGPAGTQIRTGIQYGNLQLSGSSVAYASDNGAQTIEVSGNMSFGNASGLTTTPNATNVTFVDNGAADSTLTTTAGGLVFSTLTLNKTGGGDLIFTDSNPSGGSRVINDLQLTNGTFDVRANVRIVEGVVGQLTTGEQAQLRIDTAGIEVTIGDVAGTNRVLLIHDNAGFGFGKTNVTVIMSTSSGAGATFRLSNKEAILQFSGELTSKLQLRASTSGQPGFIDAGTTFTDARTPDANRGVRASNVSVRDNDASQVISAPGVLRPISATASVDLGGNTNWDFEGGGFISPLRATLLGDGTGRVNQVQIYFSGDEQLTASSLSGNEGRFTLVRTDGSGNDLQSVTGTALAVAQTSSSKQLLITFGDGLDGTSTENIELRYAAPTSDFILNDAGVPASTDFTVSAVTSATLIDGAAPTLVSSFFQDSDLNNGLDQASFFFSEPIRFKSGTGLLSSGFSPSTDTTAMGGNTTITLQIAGETLAGIQIDQTTPQTTGDLIAAEIQRRVRAVMAETTPGSSNPSGHDPLKRPAYMNFTCTFTNGRYLLRPGVPLVFDSGSNTYRQDYTAATVSVVTGGGNDASTALKLSTAAGAVSIAGRGNATHGLSVSAPIANINNTGLNNQTARLKLNDEDFREFTITAGGEAIDLVATNLETAVRNTDSSTNDPLSVAHTSAYTAFVVVRDKTNNRLILVNGQQGSNSSMVVDSGNTFANVARIGTAHVVSGASETTGTDTSQTGIEDLSVRGSDGSNLILNMGDSDLLINGSQVTVNLTNVADSGVATPLYRWEDNGNQFFISDQAGIPNGFNGAISNVPGGASVVIVGDTDGDGILTSQDPGSGTLDASQSVPSLGTTGNTVSYSWQVTGSPAATISGGTNDSTLNFTTSSAGTYTFQLTIRVLDINGDPVITPETDANGDLIQEIQVQVQEASPIANAGPDQAVIGVSVQLDGSGSFDPNGGSIAYIWSAVDSNNNLQATSVFSDDSIVNPVFTPTNSGVYTVTLTVYKVNDSTKQATDTVEVVVNDPNNLLPVANAGPDRVGRINAALTLDGGASADPEGETLTFEWTSVSSPEPVTLSSSTEARVSFTPTLPGSYVFSLRVQAGTAQSRADQVTVLVIDDGVNSARFGPAAVPISLNLRKAVLGTAVPSDIKTTLPKLVFADGTQRDVTVVDLAADSTDDPQDAAVVGLYRVVVYNNGALFARIYAPTSASDDLLTAVEFSETVTEEVVQFAIAGESFLLDGGQSVDDGTISSYSWTQIDGPFVFTTNSGSPISVIPPSAGTYTFTLTVTDNVGLGSLTQTITVPVLPASVLTAARSTATVFAAATDPSTGVGPPKAVASMSGARSDTVAEATVLRAARNGTLTLDGSQSQSFTTGVGVTSNLTYSWTQLSGPTAVINNADQSSATVAPKQAGAYQFELKVTDTNGVSATDTIWVTVGAGAAEDAPAAGITQVTNRTLEGTTLSLSLDGGPSLGSGLTYTWYQSKGAPVFVDDSVSGVGSVTIRQPGTYTFLLVVTDENGVTSSPASTTFRVALAAESPLSSGASSSSSSGGCALEGSGAPAGGLPICLLALGLLGMRRRLDGLAWAEARS